MIDWGMESSVQDRAELAPPSQSAGPRPSIPLLLPLVLSLPAWIPLLAAVIQARKLGQVPTAFIAYDLPYYLANARQHFEQGFHLFYSNPYAEYGSPRIYFQPHLFLLALLQRIGLSPDAALVLFGIAAVAFAAIVSARLYQEWTGWRTTAHKIGYMCFFWGGGVLALAGVAFALVSHFPVSESLLAFDPSKGWWMLNFGRNLVFPTEAYYHGLFLLSVLFLIQRRFGWSLAAAAVLSMSHPFTGFSLAIILAAYGALELRLRSGAASARFLAGACAITVLHLAYYGWFLSRFADHVAVQAQWERDWPYKFWTFVPALYLVGILSFGRLTRWKNLAPALAQPRTRLCLIWFSVIFALSQHDLVISPRQPIHFAHGYDWTALFLLATPALFSLLEKLLAIRMPVSRALAIAALLLLFLSDNLLWLGSFANPSVQNIAVPITRDDRDVLAWLDAHASPPAYVVSSSEWINYLGPTFTHVRSWSGHRANTPHAVEKFAQTAAVFAANKPIPTPNPVYYIPRRDLHWTPPQAARRMYANPTYEVWLSGPGLSPSPAVAPATAVPPASGGVSAATPAAE